MCVCAAGDQADTNTDPHLGRAPGESCTLQSKHYGPIKYHVSLCFLKSTHGIISVSHLMTSQAALVTAVLRWVGLLPLCQGFLPTDYIHTPYNDLEAMFSGNSSQIKECPITQQSLLFVCLSVLTKSQSFDFTNDDSGARCCGKSLLLAQRGR